MTPPPVRVLVIEDETSIRENLVRLLKAEGFEASSAPDGATGLELCFQSVPDLVICDVMMPRLDGFAVLERVRSDPALRALPFIFLTARAERLDVRRGMSLGADDYLTKPFTRAEVLEAIHTRLARMSTLRGCDSAADLARDSLARDLKEAMDSTGGLELHYQARLCLASGSVTGAEALLRWTHPMRGRISPADFIPAAEASGLMPKLGAWVLQEACHTATDWKKHGLGTLRVSVNVSALQLREPDFPCIVRTALEKSGLPSSQLELELTESAFVHDGEAAGAMIVEIQSMGISIALDDFGTGYSALGTLRNLRFDCIKIDRSFVLGLPDEKSTSLVHSVLDLAERFHMRTVAEGIESTDAADFLKNAGCNEAQGFLYSAPIPPDEYVRFVRLYNQSVRERVVETEQSGPAPGGRTSV